MITEGNICGIRTVTLENERIRALILAGKGADILEFVYKPMNINCLYRTDLPFSAYEGHDLSQNRLAWHSEKLLGGWMDLIPHRARYKDVIVEQNTGGIAATLPWNYKILGETRVCFRADLPVVPMRVEKMVRLNGLSLVTDEKVTHNGDAAVDFTWTQHALFAGDFVDRDTEVDVPSATVFKAWEHMRNPGRVLDSYRDPVEAVTFKRGTYDLRRPLPPGYGGNEFVVFDQLREGRAALINRRLGLSVTLHWDTATLPYLRSLYQSDGYCLVGLEPGDDLFSGLEHSLDNGAYTTLAPGEMIETRFALEYGVL